MKSRGRCRNPPLQFENCLRSRIMMLNTQNAFKSGMIMLKAKKSDLEVRPAVTNTHTPPRAFASGRETDRERTRIPKGFRPKAQGCEQRATLGTRREGMSYPNGVASSPVK